jgi:hypothetical protein
MKITVKFKHRVSKGDIYYFGANDDSGPKGEILFREINLKGIKYSYLHFKDENSYDTDSTTPWTIVYKNIDSGHWVKKEDYGKS